MMPIGECFQRLRQTPMAPAPISLEAIMAAEDGEALKPIAKRLKVTLKSTDKLSERKYTLIARARELKCLHEQICAEQVAANEEQAAVVAGIEAGRLSALEQELAAARTEVAAARAETAQTAASVAALQSQLSALQRQLAQRADEHSAQEIEADVVGFNTSSALEALRGDEAGLLDAARSVVKEQLPDIDPTTIVSATLLKPKNGQPAPLVMRCSSVAAKRALLRARSRQPASEGHLRLAPRLTPWQQKQKAAARAQFVQLREQGVPVTYHCGWRLQRKDGGRWVDVPVAAAAE